MLVIGLTGGIGSGKTAVSDAFAALGVPIIDTDVIARELVQPGQPALAAIAARFGAQCLTAAGALDRARLRAIVFSQGNAQARRDLEAILHPRIGQTVRAHLAALNAPYCIVVIPLLVETGPRDYIDQVLVVDVPEALQIERVLARDAVGIAQAWAIVAAQASRAQRLAVADQVIENGGTLAQLGAKVRALHQHYLRQAAAQGC